LRHLSCSCGIITGFGASNFRALLTFQLKIHACSFSQFIGKSYLDI
jgi:hypothetical protein